MTSEQHAYPGQQARTLYAQKLRGKGRARMKRRRRPGPDRKRMLTWISALLALLLLLWLF